MACRKESRLQSLRLQHSDPSDFYTSPWFESDVPFLVYRCFAAVFCLTLLILNWTVGYYNHFTIYLTAWGYHVLTFHVVLSCVVALFSHFTKGSRSRTHNVRALLTINDRERVPQTNAETEVDGIRMDFRSEDERARPTIGDDRSRVTPTSAEETPSAVDSTRIVTISAAASDQNADDHSHEESRTSTEIPDVSYVLPWYLKLDWVVFNIGIADAFFITTVFNIANADSGEYEIFSINKHILNSVFALVDILICGIPVRVAHFVHLSAFHLIYGVFTVVYWGLGGTNDYNGQRYIYSMFDYSGSPAFATGYFLGLVLILPPVIHGAVYGLYRLRLAMLACVGRWQVVTVSTG